MTKCRQYMAYNLYIWKNMKTSYLKSIATVLPLHGRVTIKFAKNSLLQMIFLSIRNIVMTISIPLYEVQSVTALFYFFHRFSINKLYSKLVVT